MATDSAPLPPTLTAGHPLLGLGYAETQRVRPYLRLDGDASFEGSAAVAEEVPVALVYNERPHVVMMVTPADFEDFAVGFSLSEEIVPSVAGIEDCQVVRYSQGVELHLTIAAGSAAALVDRGRQLVGRTGCGLCGVQTTAEALRPIHSVSGSWSIEPAALWRAEASLTDRQTLNQATASVHAAAWATRDGELKVVREDVGRHNALDKVIGSLARQGIDGPSGFIVMTSRASYELVQKAVAVGIPMLAAVSRPTGLAIRMAEASGLTLIALLRGSSANVYTHRERLRLPSHP
jgi:formate dehydrogenase accessory protein FdhD